MLLISILLVALVQNGKSTLFQTTARVTEHSGKPPIIYVYKQMPLPQMHHMPVSAPYTSAHPAHERQEQLYAPRPLIYQSNIKQQPAYMHSGIIRQPYPSSFQLDQQKRLYLQQLDYINRQQSPIIVNNDQFRASPIDYGFKPIIKPSIPISTGFNHHHYHGIDGISDLQVVTPPPQPYGYVRSYVDLLKQRQKKHFANQEPDIVTGTRPYGNLESFDHGDEDDDDDENLSVNDGGSSADDDAPNNSVQENHQENIEHSGEVGYFKQREEEIGNQNYSGNKHQLKKVESEEKYNRDNENQGGHNPKLYRVTEDYEDPGESDNESNEPNEADSSDEDDGNSFNRHYSQYSNRNNDESSESDDFNAADEDEEETKQHTKIAQPIKVYAQVRHVEKKSHKPLKPPLYEPNLKERLSQEKRHLVYKEEGYEDKEYDHAGQAKGSEGTEQKGAKGRKRKRTKRLKKKQQRARRDVQDNRNDSSEADLPESFALSGKPFRGNKRFNQSNNLTGIALINHINELIENTTLYLPDDDSSYKKDTDTSIRSGKSVQDQVSSASDNQEKIFVSVFKPTSPEEIVNRFFKDTNAGRRPVKSIYGTKPPIECNEDDIDLDEDGFDGTKKKRGGKLGEKLDCLKNKHFGMDPFHSTFFKGELGKTGTLSNKRKLEAGKRQSANVSKVVYDDVMNTIKNSQKTYTVTSTTPLPKIILSSEKPKLKSIPIRRPQTSYLDDNSSEENIYSPSLIRSTSISSIFDSKEKRQPHYSVFDINQYYPKTIDLTTSKTTPYKFYTTTLTPSYSLTTPSSIGPAPIPFRSVHNPHQKPLLQPGPLIRHPNLIIHKQPNPDQMSLQSTQVNSHLHTNVFRPIFRPVPGKRIVVHRLHY